MGIEVDAHASGASAHAISTGAFASRPDLDPFFCEMRMTQARAIEI
jgi:hypothetical protein